MRKLMRSLISADGDSLFSRALSAGFWAATLRVVIRVLVLVRTVILANLLSPNDFGLMAVATLALLFLERFTQGGFDSALVQKDEDIEPYLNAAWTLQVARGLLIAAVLAIFAPLIATFFDAPEAVDVIRVVSIAAAIKGFTNIGVVYFVKELRFGGFFALQMSEKTADIVVSITAAIVLGNVWALVFGVVAGATTRMIVSYIIQSYRPRFDWAWDKITNLFAFGKWILWSNVLNYLTGNIDDIVVGRTLGVYQLGLYRMAYNLSQSMATEITQVTSQVTFPTYSKLQTSIGRLRKAYFGSLHLVSFVGFPLAIGTILVAPDLTLGLLGDEWEPMIRAMQLLSIAGLARGLGATTGPLFQSQGRPNVPPRFSLAKLILIAIGLYPMIDAFGMNGAAATVAIAGSITGATALWVAFRYLGDPEGSVMQTMGYPALNTAAMAVVVTGARALLFDDYTATSFVVLSLIGMVAYFAMVALTTRFTPYAAPAALLERIKQVAA
ncbi:MAG: lipopolysaccharide biosynthesis protein [Acidimicrobiia bacterium]|nr:lipopolysaccharide biosynthesis protein [Acidimicrobiia bacterium]